MSLIFSLSPLNFDETSRITRGYVQQCLLVHVHIIKGATAMSLTNVPATRRHVDEINLKKRKLAGLLSMWWCAQCYFRHLLLKSKTHILGGFDATAVTCALVCCVCVSAKRNRERAQFPFNPHSSPSPRVCGSLPTIYVCEPQRQKA